MQKLAHRTALLMFIGTLTALSGCGGGSGGGGSAGTSPPASYAIGGSVSGLASSKSLTLLDNGGDALSITSNGTFSFGIALGSGSTYAVTVGAQPSGQTCTVAQGTGTVGGQAITNVAVTCTDTTHTIGGAIAGLGDESGLVLVNGSDTYAVPAGATTFTMPTAVAEGSTYDVTVQAHPPALTCSISGGAGTMSNANVTDISISCTAAMGSVVYSFYGGPDAGGPEGSLIQASNGDFYGLTMGGGVNGGGAVFEMTPSGTESVLYSFAGTDGQLPYGDLVQGSDGNFYGMTQSGGAGTVLGTVFEITPGGTETVLHSFGGGSDGAYPYGNLIQASNGNFYGLTTEGGTDNEGTVFEITAAGIETVLHSFVDTPTDGAYPYGSLIQASDGNLYGMTADGGANNAGSVFRITLTGTETVLYSFAGGTGDGAHPYGNLIQASNGDFYGMTEAGGTYGLGTVFEITPAGTETILHSFAGTPADGANPEGSLIQANDGNFYGMTEKGGAYISGAIFRMTPAGTDSILYSFPGSYGGQANTYGDLIQTRNGDLYGLASFGTYTYGEIFLLN